MKTFTVSCEKSKTISFASSIKKNNAACWPKFPAKLICCIAFGSASSACVYFAIIYCYNLIIVFKIIIV